MDSETINGTFLRNGDLAWYRQSYDVMVPVRIEKIPDDHDTIKVKITGSRGRGMRKGDCTWVAASKVYARDTVSVTRIAIKVFGRTLLVPDSIANKAIPIYRVEAAPTAKSKYTLFYDDINYERALDRYNLMVVGNGGKKRLTKDGVVKRRQITAKWVTS